MPEHLPPLDAEQWNDMLYMAVRSLLKWPPDPNERHYCQWLAEEWKRQHVGVTADYRSELKIPNPSRSESD